MSMNFSGSHLILSYHDGSRTLIFTPEWAFMIFVSGDCSGKNSGGYRSRTDDLLRARQAL